MANEETVGTIVQKLALDMKEFETSVKKAEGISKALKASMSDLGTLTVDPSGKLSKTLDDYTVSSEKATQTTRGFFREQRLQDRVFKESVASISGAVFALSLFTQGSDKAASTTKTVTQSLLAGVGAANAAEFGFFGLGKSLSGLPGIVGKLGSSLMGLGGPISMALGIGAALITFFQQTNAEAKKAADEGIKAYTDAIEKAAGTMDKFLPAVEAAQEKLYRNSLARVEAQLTLFKSLQDQIQSGTTSVTISPEEAAAAGISAAELGAMTPAMIAERIARLEAAQRETAALLRTVGNTVTRNKPLLRPEDIKTEKTVPEYTYSERDKRVAGVLRLLYKTQEEEQKRLDKQQSDAMAAREKREQGAKKGLYKFQEEREAALEKARAGMWERDASAIENLGNVMQSTFNFAGDSFLAKMLKALQIAMQIARALRAANAAEGDFGSVLGVIGSIIPGIGLLFGASTGTAPRTSEAVNRAYAPSGSNGGTGIRVSGRVDLSNGKLFLIQEMPGYSNHLANKTV